MDMSAGFTKFDEVSDFKKLLDEIESVKKRISSLQNELKNYQNKLVELYSKIEDKFTLVTFELHTLCTIEYSKEKKYPPYGVTIRFLSYSTKKELKRISILFRNLRTLVTIINSVLGILEKYQVCIVNEDYETYVVSKDKISIIVKEIEEVFKEDSSVEIHE